MKAVLFDLFETLVTHFDPNWVPPPQTIAERLGIEEETYLVLWDQAYASWMVGHIGSHEEVLLRICRTARVEPDVELIRQLDTERHLQANRPFASIETGILEMLDSLRQSGFKLGIITNADDIDTAPWATSPLAGYFDDVIASHEVGLAKPDTRIFQLACERLEIEPAQTAFVGDGGANELFGASQSGLTPYWCTWFLDKWPAHINPNGFEGDEWRRRSFKGTPPFHRVHRPHELIEAVRR